VSFPKSLSNVWSGGIKELQQALLSQHFHCDAGTLAPAWSPLAFPVSVDSPRLGQISPDQCYAYWKAGAEKIKTLPRLGLLLADLKLRGTIEESVPILWCSYPDAAMDFILRKTHAAEWAGPSEKAPPQITAEEPYQIGPDVAIGAGTVLESFVRIGRGVRIGKNCRIGAGSRIADFCVMGDDCTLAGMNAIGGQGFGTLKYPGSEIQRTRLHVGRVVIGNRVRLGSHVSVDRGVFDDTVLGDDSLFDNHVQVGHNCVIGKNSIFCSFVGLSGSTEVGDQSVFAGMVGTAGHVRIGSRVLVAAQSGISKDIEDGQQVKGYPPKPLPEALKIQTLVGKLPELYARLKKLEKSEDIK
jgi:UDP-3-O-[3-hydroxymyristoyl] glucosamine N-acyltransferase